MTPDPTLLEAPPEQAEPPAPALAGEPIREPKGNSWFVVAFVAALILLGMFGSWWIPGLILGLLGVLFLHELGHFVTARASGMKVTEFFLGFGPRLWSFRRGETEYGLKAIPAGAYVKIIGMTNLEEVDPAEEHRTYRAQPWWQRMVTICAGSAMHFAMALVALVVLFAGYQYPGFNGFPWEVATAVEGSGAAAMGIQEGDRVTSFNGESFDTWDEFADIVAATPVGPIEVTVERNGAPLLLTGELGARSGDVLGLGFGLSMAEDRASQGWTLTDVDPQGPAATVGFEVGDVVLRAGGAARPNQSDFAAVIQDADGGSLDATVLRNGAEVTLGGAVTLDRSEPWRGFLGVAARNYRPPEPGVGEAVRLAISDFGTVAAANVGGLVDLLNPLNLVDSVHQETTTAPSPGSGTAPVATPDDDAGQRPVSIIGVFRLMASSESADQVLYIFMIVNIFIGMFNLAPLLPLDGGHAALATYERGRQLVTRDADYRVDAGRLVPFVWAFILLLVAIGVWAVILDIFAWSF